MKPELELYIHIPFCAKKCSYCDFLSFCATAELQQKYMNQLIGEIEATSSICVPYEIRSVFIGGGTPSVLEPQYITAVMDAVQKRYYLAKDAEITIEVNPASTLRHKFSAYRRAGINRLSIGLQSADNGELRMLGRLHTYEEFLKAYQGARMEGFQNINIDLINCIPMQTMKTWKKTLRSVLMLKPEHVSVYNLIVEPGTPFEEMQKAGLLMLPGEEETAEIDAFTGEYLAKTGYERYEISNYARPGFACRHNLGYWTEVPYLGFGLGAASYYEGLRWSNTREMEEYLAADFRTRAGFEAIRKGMHSLSKEEAMEEFMFLGLRMVKGVSETDFLMHFQQKIENVYGEVLRKYLSLSLMEHADGHYRLTPRGMDVSNIIMSDFLLTDAPSAV
ncbi:MAG: radical SAM family heme chaperone HemW [Eubacteriales bacterium]|nr:radical SAM family heme chaperone HemW [Eubacteriales bacterium]